MTGLAKASLVVAKRKMEEDGSSAKFLEFKTNILVKLNGLYSACKNGITLTEKTLDYMIDENSRQRLNRAIELSLPPIVREAVKKLKESHDNVQFFLQAA